MIDWKAKSIVNQAIRANSDAHQALVMEKSLYYDLGLDEDGVNKVLDDIEHEIDQPIEIEDYREVSVGNLYYKVKQKLSEDD